MTKVFVHGNPETTAVWGPLLDQLAEHGVTDTVALAPPGFGAPVPEGWDALPATYVSWLAAELEAIIGRGDGPIDLVGHDWGAGHVVGLAAARPDLIRSFATDCAGLVNPAYVWHDAAQQWQTEGVGEEAIGGMVGAPKADVAALYEGLGMTPEVAVDLANALTPEMGDCVLRLYRGAVPPMLSDLADRLEAAESRPWLIIDAKDDPYVSTDLVPAVVERHGASTLELPGQSHWWMMEPAVAAEGLAAWWSTLS